MSVTKRPVIDTIETNYLALLNRNSYEKGGFVLHMLRAQVGERAFFDALRSYYVEASPLDGGHRRSARRDGARVEAESRLVLRSVAAAARAIPRSRRPGRTTPAAHEVAINVAQNPRFGLFQFPLAIAVIDSSGVAHQTTVELSGKTDAPQQVRVPLASAPARVVLDPNVESAGALDASSHRAP